jgi:hypothetical protein
MGKKEKDKSPKASSISAKSRENKYCNIEELSSHDARINELTFLLKEVIK